MNGTVILFLLNTETAWSYAKELNQSPAILSAVLEQSGWNPNARLPSGRAGIGLLSPEMARRLDIDVTNPDESIKGVATQMLSLIHISEPTRPY